MSFEQLKQDLEDIAGGRWHSSAIETQAEEQKEKALSVQDIGQVPSFHDASQAVREQSGILPGMDEYGQCYVDRGSRGLSPIEKVLPLNAPFKMNMQTMGQIFNGDPLAFIADPKQRQHAESLVEISPDPERTRRRLALAAYFTMVRPVRNEDGGMMNMSLAYAYRNAESLATIFTNGKGGIDQAYDSIRQTLEWNPENPAASMPKSLKFRIAMEEGTSRIGNTIYNLASIPFYMAGAKEMGDYVQKYKHELYDQYTEAQREYGVPADWMTNSDSFVDWVFNAATATAAYMPSLSAQVALGAVTSGLAPYALGAMFAIDDYFDTRHEHPEASRGQALLHAGLIGVINGLSEQVLMGVASGSISRHYVKNGLKPGLARAAAYLGIDTVTNAAQEALEQIAENASDLLCGTGDRKWSEMSGRERYDYIMQGVPEAAFLGGVTGLGMSAGNYKGMRDYYNRVNQGYAAIAKTRAELEAKTANGESLTEADAARLRYCQRAMDSVDADACANAAIANQQWELKKALQEEAARRNAERDAQKAQDIDAESRAAEDSELSAYFTEQLSDDEDAGDVSQDTWDAAEQALRNLKIKATEGTHKVNDTIRAVYEFLKNVPGVKCQVLTDAKSIPQHVKDQLKADGLAEDQMRGCVGRDNVVYIRADLVRPSEVEHVLTHEVVGHIGLENYFGHRFVPFLDEVYDQHFQRMDAIRELYRLGGRADTPETRRAITREWLAEMAAKMPDQRPRVWTDIANRLRLFMHRIGFKSYWSDRDLAALFVADRRHLVAASPELIRENVRQANEALGIDGSATGEGKSPRSGATLSLRSKYSSDDISDYIAVLKTAVGTRKQKSDSIEKWMQWCRDHYIKVDAADVMEFVEQARAENRVAARREHQDKVEEYICQTEDIFNALQQLGYSPYEVYQRKIVPTAETSGGGEIFTGTFIHPAFQSKSKAASMDYDASDDRMRKTASRIKERQHAAATATDAGMAKAPLAADDVARMINDKLGTNYTDEDIQNYFIGKTWEGLEKKYRQHLKDAEDEAKYWEEVGKEQLLNEKKARIEDEAISFLENPREVTMEYAEDNPEVVKKLWQMLLPSENYGQKLEEDGVALDADSLNILNSALQLGQFDAAAVAESIRRMRQEEHATYMQKLRDLDANIRQKELDVARLQRDAVAFAKKALPEDARWSFMDAIMKLPRYGTTPTVRHPEGRRMAEFHKILEQVLQKQSEVRRSDDIADINRMLDSAKQGRNWRGIPVSIIPSEQSSVDLIRQVMKWDPAAVAAAVEDRMTTLQTLDDTGTAEDDGKRGRIEKELALIAKFGNLEYRDAKDAAEAVKELKNIIGGAKATFREQLTERAKWLDQRRTDLIRKLTGGRPLTDIDARAGFLKRFLDSNDTLETTLAMLYGDPTDFDATEGGKLFQRIVDATYAASGQRMHLDLAFREALESCAGAKTASQRARFIQQLRDVHEHTGALKRHYTRVNEDSQGNTLEFSDRHGAVRRRVRIEDSDGRTGARTIVRMADQGIPLDQISRQLNEEIGGKSFIRLTPASIEWLRQQIADRDAGVQNIRDVYGDDLDNDALARMESDSADATVEIISDSPKTTYKMQEVTDISKAQALQIILTWEQEQYRHGMEWNGWTQDSIDALKKFAGKEALALGYWMRDQIAKNRDALDSAVYKRFGAHLPDNPNYWPGKFQNDRSGVIRAQGSNGISSLSITPAFLTARRFHLQPVALDIDAIDVFFNNQNQQIQMLAFGDVMRDAQGIFGNANVQKAIRNRFGEHAARNVMKLLGNIANNGAIGDDISKFISVFYRSYVPAKIAFNPSALAKQLLGAASYALDVPMKDMAVAMADVASWSPEYRHFRKLAKNSDYYKARTQQGANPELQIINGDQAFRHGAIMQGVTSAASFLTTQSDATAALTVGYASFKYARDNAIKQGMDAKDADAAALMAWQRATDETQQSGYLKDANQYMAARGLSRAFTMFMSNSIQTMQVEKRAYRAWRNARGDAKADALAKLIRVAAVNHVIIPGLMFAVSKAFRDGWDDWDWRDTVDLASAMLLGSFEGVYVAGRLIQGMITSLMTGDAERSPEAIPAIGDLYNAARTYYRTGGKIIEGEELTAKDFLDFVQGTGTILEPLGITWQPLGDAGMVLDAIGTQGKRMNKLLENDERKKKKRRK